MGNLCWIGHALGRKDHQQTVTVWIFRSNFDGARIAIRIRIAQNVDGIVMTPMRGQKLVEPLQAIGREFSQFATIGDQRVGGEHSRSAGVG